MSRRTEQAGAALTRALQTVLAKGLNDPRISGLITVTDLRLSDDLRNAHAFISVMPEEKQRLTLQGLQAAAQHIRREIGELVDMRRVPDFMFSLDEQFKKQAAVLRAIASIEEERSRRPAPAEPEGEDRSS